ncbi:MAG: tetratricopeptide repeat protein [Pseudanabaena sp. M57BS1SP1A06MG]|nr:tetratricopeptide repeat protein [Pseudanabaena sp. M53BS1SP1A06MG]MCA6581363.1 tetratricopeptide repeat protein [Pseudanabaena sp. M34BS1SP1A06MG]MCA6602524.1 tetratricopeptide repeat protein [Pseudanabaena sp. M57BS1SP1A06MG]
MDRSSQQNNDDFFDKAYDEWDFDRLVSDLEKIEHLARHQKRNLKAILLSFSPKKVATLLGIQESSLRPAFSNLYRLIENLTQEPSNTVTYKNAKFVLASYRKQKNSLDGSLIDEKSKALVQSPQPPTNPQNIHTPEPIPELTPLDFIGRDRDLTNLTNLSRQAKIVLIKAGAGVGKSTLAREFLQTQFKKVIRIEMGLESGNVTPAEEKVSQILRKDLDEEPSRDFGINLDILREKLADRANPIGVLLDNLEPALDENYRFRENLRGYDALLAVLGDRDVFSFTLITSRRSLIAPRAKVNEYSLEGLDITAWRQYFHDCENGGDLKALLQMRDAYNGNAKVMDILHGAIKNRFDGNIGAYWNRYKDALLADSELETLISVEMDWLRDNQPDAYKLLCRMGCYRYQDVKTVPFEGLICLLWDVSESQKVRVIDYLSRTSLIEVKGEYYLHPAIREIAKLRLLENQIDWEKANQQAATYWTNSTKITAALKDAVRAFEAYHHYFCINAYNLAGEVIITPRSDGFYSSPHYQGELLGRSLYRLGLLEKTILSINLIVNQVNIEICRSQLYNILGDCYWLNGKPSKAIDCHQSSKTLSNIYLEKTNNLSTFEPTHIRWVEQLSRSYLLNTGLCKLDLWELEEAYNLFLELKSISENTDFYSANLSANFCLAVTSVRLEMKDQAESYTEIAYSQIHKDLGYWTGGYKFVFLGETYEKLNNIPKSVDMYSRAISLANETTFTQVKGKAFYGLAVILRKHKKFKASILHNLAAMKLLIKIGANSDLAEAYFQLGLTYQAMGEHDQAEEYKAKAIELFEQMEAPKQIERVNKAFEQGGM